MNSKAVNYVTKLKSISYFKAPVFYIVNVDGICKIYASGKQDNFNYLVMEKLGESLDELLTRSYLLFNIAKVSSPERL
jgi:hypothetical protein